MKNNKYNDLFSRKIIFLDQANTYSTSWEDVPFLRQIILSDAKFKDEYLEKINKEIDCLKDIKVWIRARRTEKVSNLYELYNFFLDSRVRHIWSGSMDNILVSTISRTGVFTHITDLRWFDRKLYQQFILKRLLNNQNVGRSFRVGTNLKCHVELNEVKKSCNIHQITSSGLLFNITDISFKNMLENHDDFCFLLPRLTPRCRGEHNFYCSYISLTRFNHVKSFQLDHHRECFIFIPYTAMRFDNTNDQIQFKDNLNWMLEKFYNTLQTNVYAFNKLGTGVGFINSCKEVLDLSA